MFNLKLKTLVGISTVALSLLSLGGCAVGSASAGYAMRAGTADELKAEARKAIIDDAVTQASAQCGCKKK